MKYFKVSLFTFICGILFMIMANITQLAEVTFLASLSWIIAIMSLVLWGCSVIMDRFRYSKNVVCIILFASLSFLCYFFAGGEIYVMNADGLGLSSIGIAFLVSVSATFVSIIVLVWRIIFRGDNPSVIGNMGGESTVEAELNKDKEIFSKEE